MFDAYTDTLFELSQYQNLLAVYILVVPCELLPT